MVLERLAAESKKRPDELFIKYWEIGYLAEEWSRLDNSISISEAYQIIKSNNAVAFGLPVRISRVA